MNKLTQRGTPNYIIRAMHSMIAKTRIRIGGDKVSIESGMPLGNVLSSQLFNLYIDDLLIKLSASGVKVLPFANDIFIVSNSQLKLLETINTLENWIQEKSIKINRKKSAILELKQGQRTPSRLPEKFRGFPTTKSYKYLGMLIDDEGILRAQSHHNKNKLKTLRNKLTCNGPVDFLII